MNKTYLALSVASILSIPTFSLADTTLYGELHNSLDMVDVGATSNNISHSNNKSFLGIKGGEKISDNLSAVYKIEFGPDIGGGSDTLSNRDQYVGLETKLGTLVAGRMSTPFKEVGRKADLFWSSQLGQNRNLTRSNRSIRTGISVGLADMDGRFDNTIKYTSPKKNGFQGSISHVTEEQNDGRGSWSSNVMYEHNGLTLGVGYEKQDDLKIGNITTIEGGDAYRLMAAYDTGKVKVVGFYQNARDQGFTKGNDSTVVGAGASLKTVKGVVKAQYYVASDLDCPNDANCVNGKDDNGAKMFAVGYDHNLSKRTVVYAQYAQIENDSKGGYGLGLGAGGHSESVTTVIDSSGNAKDQKGVSVGIKHSF